MPEVLAGLLGIGILGLLFGAGLALAGRRFAVELDPKEEALTQILPQANCGACGYPGCAQFARALTLGEADPSSCAACSMETRQKIGEILGIEIQSGISRIAVPLCIGGLLCENRAHYEGAWDCRAASLLAGSFKSCPWACLGLGSCERTCPFDAIRMGESGLPTVSSERCTACGRCVEICPVDVFVLWPRDKTVRILCRNENKGKAVSRICSKGCIACQACVKICPVDAIFMQQGRAVLLPEKCISCGLCVKACPVNCIVDDRTALGKAWIDAEACIGCGLCAKICPVDAIEGRAKEPHEVHRASCMGCGMCGKRCPRDAITFS